MKTLLATAISFALAFQAHAALIPFDLVGTAGAGLLPGNEPGMITGGTGGEIGAGITYNDDTNLLTLNVGWGSSQGFTNLSSTATVSHIHGPTASINGNGFTETGGTPFTLTRSSDAVTGGTFTNAPITLTALQETQLLEGRFYINLHTSNNGGGEMRGFLVPVPEPTSIGLLAVGVLGIAARRGPRGRKLRDA